MKVANETFDQWRDEARFLCDQYSHAHSRADFYYNEIYIVKRNSLELQPQLDRWLLYRNMVDRSLLLHFKRGQRWLIDEEDMVTVFRLYLPFDVFYKFLSKASPESRRV